MNTCTWSSTDDVYSQHESLLLLVSEEELLVRSSESSTLALLFHGFLMSTVKQILVTSRGEGT